MQARPRLDASDHALRDRHGTKIECAAPGPWTAETRGIIPSFYVIQLRLPTGEGKDTSLGEGKDTYPPYEMSIHYFRTVVVCTLEC